MIAKALCLHPSEDNGLAVRTKKTKLSLKKPTLSTKGSNQTLQESHALDDSEIPQRANLQEALRQLDDNHYGDQLICQNLGHFLFYRRRIIV